jgi:hypothetical protein
MPYWLVCIIHVENRFCHTFVVIYFSQHHHHGIGLGPIPWLIVAEMFDAKYVATAMSMACIVNWACNFLVGLCFPFIQQALGTDDDDHDNDDDDGDDYNDDGGDK